jgi:hypothetical protein
LLNVMLIWETDPELSEIANRFPRIDVALLPINGLRVFGKKVVMDPHEAAELCAPLYITAREGLYRVNMLSKGPDRLGK